MQLAPLYQTLTFPSPQVPAGDRLGSETAVSDRPCVLTAYHSRLLAQLVASHAVHDVCLVGPRGCGKSAIVRHLADLLGYQTEPVVLYQVGGEATRYNPGRRYVVAPIGLRSEAVDRTARW